MHCNTPSRLLRPLAVHIAFIAALAPAPALAAAPPADSRAWLHGWPGYGRNAQHTALTGYSAQPLNRIKWSMPVDLAPQYSGNLLLIHYGTPMVTHANTVVVPVKTGASGGFRVEARRSTDGSQLWSVNTDYLLPPHNWTPSMGCTLTVGNEVVIPAAGGTILRRTDADLAAGTTTRIVYYGQSNYNAAATAYNNNVWINTPITSDNKGNIYFGVYVGGSTPLGLASSIVRIGRDGTMTTVTATAAAADAAINQVTHNCAPALSSDGAILYINVRTPSRTGYLLALDSTTLATINKVLLRDPLSNSPAQCFNDGTSSPMVGPDGDVYFGVLEQPLGANNFRGFMLHFNRTLTQTKIPGGFGWDVTPSVVDASAVPSYTGTSKYLILTKYNNYAGAGGDGVNKVAVLDPFNSFVDPISGATVMQEVITVAGPTPDPEYVNSGYPDAVREWCINTAAVDRLGKCAMVNCEDGKLYRWNFITNSLGAGIVLTPGIGEAYTPTVIGPDGTVYAINNATLFAVGN